jgi:SAM-dependent methyltransferase
VSGVDRLTGDAWLREQYDTEHRLDTRRSVWRPSADGRTPQDVAAAAIGAEHPSTVLEVGCGTGGFAERLAAENPSATVLGTDRSDRFVVLTAARGVGAQQADVRRLPFADQTFDVVAALWMLYHVAELDEALAEIRRVLRAGGLFVAVTNGDQHLVRLLRDAGGAPLVTGFSSENGAAALGRHFGSVAREDIATRAVFTHAAAVEYLATFDASLAGSLPEFSGPREYPGATTVFLAR